MTQHSSSKARRIGVCPDCRLIVYMRKDGTAYKHRLRLGAEDQLCTGSGRVAEFKRFENVG